MAEIFQLSWSLGIGAFLGLLFFFGLWKTLQLLPVSRHPSLLIGGSTILRMGIVVLGFWYLVREGQWDQLMVGLVGFLAIRVMVTHRLGVHGSNLSVVKG